MMRTMLDWGMTSAGSLLAAVTWPAEISEYRRAIGQA